MLLVTVGVLFLSPLALGEVRRDGTWPEEPTLVTLSIQGKSRVDAIRKLAEEAGWSVVVRGLPDDAIDIEVKKQPASKVLELVLADGRYVARRDGDLVSIAPLAADETAKPEPPVSPPSAAPVPPTPRPSALPAVKAGAAGSWDGEDQDDDAEDAHEDAEDRVVTGGSTRVGKGEVVHDLVVLGGSAEVLGKVTGDVAVMGGSVTIRSGAKVEGDATAFGGSMTVEDGAKIEGDVAVVGGKLNRAKGSKIGGRIANKGGSVKGSDESGDGEKESWTMAELASDAGAAMTRTAMLFVFGAVLLALATRRMEKIELEVAGRPMRSFALGVVGGIAAILAFVVLCVTIIGIPVALIGLLVAILAAYAGICAVLTTVGGALLKHRTDNAYVHLALGCVVYLVAGALPVIGGIVTFVVVLLGIGAVLASRGAGLYPRNGEPSSYEPAEGY